MHSYGTLPSFPLSRASKSNLTISSLLAVIFCFLSTCLGLSIRRSDLVSALSFPTPTSIRAKDEARRKRAAERQRLGLDPGESGGERYEMGNMTGGVERTGVGGDDWEMMRRGGGRGGLY